MSRLTILKRGICVSALVLLSATSAFAGKSDRAREAIAQAQAKVESANKVGATGEVPRIQAEAEAALRTAREELARGHKGDALTAANRASALADTALGMTEKNRAEDQNAQRSSAEAAAANAQQDAASANARADAAQQAAASAAADAAAARAAPPPAPVAMMPAPAPTTTVTTETVKSTATAAPTTHRVVKRVVHHRPATRATVTEKTTTTVKTQPN